MKIFCIIGKTGSGKDTIRNFLLNRKELDINILSTTVDREIRPDEKAGVNHIYITRDEMDKYLIGNDVMFVEEWSDPKHPDYKNRYALIKPAIDGTYLLTCALSSYVKLKERTDIEVLPIYLYAGGAIRLQRCINREGNISNPALIEVCRRFINDEEDYSDNKLREAGIQKHQGFKNDGSIINTTSKVLAYILANTREERLNK